MARAKDPAAVSLGRRGGLAGKGKTSPAKAAAARENGARGGAPPKYRLLPSGALQKREGSRWRLLVPPYDANARAFLRRQNKTRRAR